MATAHYSRAVSGDVCDVINTALGTAATINFYTAPMPADTTVGITTQTQLGICVCDNPAGIEAGGTLTFEPIANEDAALATGVCTWVRIADSAATTIMDLDVTATGGGGYVQMASTSITAGGPIAFNSFTITLP